LAVNVPSDAQNVYVTGFAVSEFILPPHHNVQLINGFVDIELFMVAGVPPFVSYDIVYIVPVAAVTDNVVL
jgi:hypothetical protein